LLRQVCMMQLIHATAVAFTAVFTSAVVLVDMCRVMS
jgi:hypothetical protein